jgi:uncharacterized repeat protein (TIGR03987 family)
MDSGIIRAVVVVTCALVFYSIGVITEQRNKAVSRRVLVFLTGGVALDISATALMILGSTNYPFTVHGFLGYAALLLMLIDAVLIWRHWLRQGGTAIARQLNIYTRFAYGWWVIAYIVGAIMNAVLA